MLDVQNTIPGGEAGRRPTPCRVWHVCGEARRRGVPDGSGSLLGLEVGGIEAMVAWSQA